jgi:hypothetical protein
VRFFLFAACLLLVSSAGAEGFGSVLPPGQTQYVAKDFTIDVPAPGARVSVENPRPDLVNVDFALSGPPLGAVNLYSIEWADWSGHKTMTDEETYAYWATFVPNWLHKDFNDGHYDLLFQGTSRFQEQYPALIFVGSGVHNNGQRGSIYAMAVYMGHHMAFMYALKELPIVDPDHGLKSIASLKVLPQYQEFDKFARSLNYTGAAGSVSPITQTQAQTQQTPLATAPSMREMPFDEFLAGILSEKNKIPIKIAIPAEYVHSTFANSPFSSYWMTPAGAEKAQRTGDLPTESGWIFGELSSGVGYDIGKKAFTGLDVSDKELSRAGFTLVSKESGVANGYPITFLQIVNNSTKKPVYMMYVATLLGTNVVVVSYRPANNDRVLGDAVWSKLKESVSAH